MPYAGYGSTLTNDFIRFSSKILFLKYNGGYYDLQLGHDCYYDQYLGFLAKIYNDFRKAEKAIRNEVRDLRTDVHESERRMSGEIREVSDKVAELRGVLKGSRALPV